MKQLKLLILLLTVGTGVACNSATTVDSTTTTKDAITTTATVDSALANQTIIQQYFAFFNKHQWQQMAAMYVDTPTMQDPAYGIVPIKISTTEIVKKYTELGNTIADVTDSIIQMYPSGNNVIVQFKSSGTAPDGNKFTLPICTIFEIINGKITKDLTYYDNVETINK